MSAAEPPSTTRLHVAFYMPDLSGGGVERMRLSLISALQARGVKVTLIVGLRVGYLSELLPKNVPLRELGSLRTLRAIPLLVRFLQEDRPDILVSSLDHNNIAAMIACVMSGSATRLVICQHNALSAEHALGWKYRLVPWAYRILHPAANAVVAVSRGVANDLIAVTGIKRSKISVIYNPVLGEDFDERSRAEPQHPWLAEKICPVFVFVGRLCAQKDAFTLLAAMELLLRRVEARLILLGDGEDEILLRREAIRLGIAHTVAFVGFQLNPLPWIKHADALVSSSRYEGLGNAIVEALACGTQVIATDCPHGPSEILLEGALGILVAVGDAKAMADAMAQVVTAGFEPAKLQARAASFTTAVCADAHLNLFRCIMEARERAVHSLGMNLSPLSCQQVVSRILQEQNLATIRILVTPNLDHVRLLRRPDFAAAYAAAHLVCPDGLPVLLYARLRGLKLGRRVTGCEVFRRLTRDPLLRLQRLFLVVESVTTEVAARAWALRLGIADCVVIAVAPLGLGGDISAQNALVRRISDARPNILVMTLGAPISEVFLHQHRHSLPPCWALCVGQALRVELRLTQRAPLVWQQLGMEWFWRLGHEPRRLIGRYARDLAWFPVAVWRDIWRHEPAQGG